MDVVASVDPQISTPIALDHLCLNEKPALSRESRYTSIACSFHAINDNATSIPLISLFVKQNDMLIGLCHPDHDQSCVAESG
jgi:hypothetical protein